MINFSIIDILTIVFFFCLLLFFGFLPSKKKYTGAEDYLLSNRKVGLTLFVLTNVATWYGGILGVGEFTYRYGLLSWLTQGVPYYIFAIIFAFLFAKKIRNASLFTIPEKIEQVYGKKVSILAAVLIFILVSPAPYILMVGNLISIIFNIDLFWALFFGTLVSVIYLFFGGYRSDLFTDAFQFFIMFIGFIILLLFSFSTFGGLDYLEINLPETHLEVFGGASPLYIIVWFFIALWTFADPGFHQRCYAAKTSSVAFKGILISIIFWFLFDFLTTSTGLYSKAALTNIKNPMLAYPMYADKILPIGLKGIFFSALFATILSTLNSFLFLSATTFSRDFILKFKKNTKVDKTIFYTRIGLVVSSLIAIIFACIAQSVISLWYSIGSLCIPALILLVVTSYYEKFKVQSQIAFISTIIVSLFGIIWLIARNYLPANSWLFEIEPMLVGLFIGICLFMFSSIFSKFIMPKRIKN
ncbi:MAG: sodium:solute symporter family protein [Ignavibacteriales bacterium]|nr:sodium:solute symporter family protein [Ignavibacteriales bacterium]